MAAVIGLEVCPYGCIVADAIMIKFDRVQLLLCNHTLHYVSVLAPYLRWALPNGDKPWIKRIAI
jgi:hypothetical protein